jgi:hypothetical protein
LRIKNDIAKSIQSLLNDRQKHQSAIAMIDAALSRVEGLLQGNGAAVKVKAPKATRGRRTRRKFAVTGENMIVNFVKSKSSPMGREIEKQWKHEGRAGVAANLISKLVKAKMLKRVPLKDQRGSRYTLA